MKYKIFQAPKFPGCFRKSPTILKENPDQTYFDYINLGGGSASIKVNFNGASFNPTMYDRENGQGMALQAIQSAHDFMPTMRTNQKLKKFLIT